MADSSASPVVPNAFVLPEIATELTGHVEERIGSGKVIYITYNPLTGLITSRWSDGLVWLLNKPIYLSVNTPLGSESVKGKLRKLASSILNQFYFELDKTE
jgi:hypothetical protein